jgi:hypothetical protein
MPNDNEGENSSRRRGGSDAATAAVAAGAGAGIGIGTILVIVFGILGCLGACGVVGVVIALVVPGVQKVREAAARVESTNNLKEQALACISYADRNGGRLPSPKVQNNPQGPPVELSWRVSVLPFMMSPDAMTAANRFDLNSAWDSPRNQPHLSPMPKVYDDKARGDGKGDTTTPYQQFTGANTLWPDNGVRRFPAAIPDGTSNTFLIAESATPVPWTKAADMAIEPQGPLPLPPNRFLAAFADGSVRLINRSQVNDATLRLFIDPKDGQVVPLLD